MTPADQTSPDKSSASQPRGKRGQRPLGRLWSEWRVEIIIVLVIAFAIFLLVERMQIRQTLFGWLRQWVEALKGVGGNLLQGVSDFVRRTTLSDFTAYVLLLGVGVVVAWRLRWRLTTTPRFSVRECPRCGGKLHRVHRRFFDRLVSVYVPVARYRCQDHNCRWNGLRVKTARHE